MNINNNYQNNVQNFTAKIQVAKIKKMIEEGKSMQEIAVITGHSMSNIYKVLRNLDIKTPNKLKVSNQNSPEIINMLIDKITQGKSVGEISLETGINKSTIYHILKINNIHTPSKRTDNFAARTLPSLIYSKNRSEISKETGLSFGYITRWIEKNLGITFFERKQNLLNQLVQTRMSDAEIAAQTGLTIHGVRDFRYKFKINANVIRREILDKEILAEINAGRNKKEIAQKLNVSVDTVRRHLSKLKSINFEA